MNSNTSVNKHNFSKSYWLFMVAEQQHFCALIGLQTVRSHCALYEPVRPIRIKRIGTIVLWILFHMGVYAVQCKDFHICMTISDSSDFYLASKGKSKENEYKVLPKMCWYSTVCTAFLRGVWHNDSIDHDVPGTHSPVQHTIEQKTALCRWWYTKQWRYVFMNHLVICLGLV